MNLAGCGGGSGGGGGGGVVSPTATPAASVTVALRTTNGQPTNGTVTLNGRTLSTTNGRAVFSNVRPGTYTLRFTAGGTTTTTSIVVTTDRSQSFSAVPGVTGVSGAGITVRGRIFVNPGDPTSINCGPSSLGVSARVLVRVRDLNTPGRPIVASYIKPDQSSLPSSAQGTYVVVNVPGPGTYQVEVRQAPQTSASDSIAPFFGNSASFTVQSRATITDLNICANPGTFAPGGTPPPPPITATPTSTSTPGPGTPTAVPTQTPGGPTATPIATQTPGGPTATPVATQTPGGPTATPGGPTATPGGPTATPGGVPTPTTGPTNTPTPTPTPTLTPTPGGPTATPTATAAPTAAPTATPIVPGPGSSRRHRSRRG